MVPYFAHAGLGKMRVCEVVFMPFVVVWREVAHAFDAGVWREVGAAALQNEAREPPQRAEYIPNRSIITHGLYIQTAIQTVMKYIQTVQTAIKGF